MINIHRSSTILKADRSRVILLFNSLGLGTYATTNRAQKLVDRVLNLTEADVETTYNMVLSEFNHRHRDLKSACIKYYSRVSRLVPSDLEITENRKLLLGAHFIKEYSIQAAALFNPSMVPHPDQNNLKDGQKRFIISLRSVGEGHISSIEFRSGTASGNGDFVLDEISPYATCLEKNISAVFNKSEIKRRTSIVSELNTNIFDEFPQKFGIKDYVTANNGGKFKKFDEFSQLFLAKFMDTNYNLVADSNSPISERVIFPSAKGESMGMEDVRFVEFVHDNEEKEYIGTYTAYDGRKITPQLIRTHDFIHFRIRTMFGSAVSDKGFALFPEKINGKYVMTARQGGEAITIMESNDLYNWDNYKVIMIPQYHWGLVQMGNCGSPIKTENGWLLITHGVGPMRKYVISAILLDLGNPKNVIGKLNVPLISPIEEEREGYVPNVVYGCGSIAHNDMLLMPYAMSDSATSFASFSISEILKNISS